MIRIEDTPNMIGITIHGDYEDLQALHHAISDYLQFYFDHQEGSDAYSCYETILGLCYDLRHAYQGDRNFESVDNNHDGIAVMASNIYNLDSKATQRERNKYKNGNLYFNVEVLYPWAVFYLFSLQAISDDIYRTEWFVDSKFPYTEYQAEHDLALIQYFVQLLWGKLRENLPADVMDVLWQYTRMYNHAEYYFDVSDMYMEWFCQYWVNAGKTREGRKELLPLLCLELSSILDEDENELNKTINESEEKLARLTAKGATTSHKKAASADHKAPTGQRNKNASGKNTGDNTINSNNVNNDTVNRKKSGTDAPTSLAEEAFVFEKDLLNMQTSIAQNILHGLKLYDRYADSWYQNELPYQNMDEFCAGIYTYVKKHGQFDDDSFDEWLESMVGEVNWERMEW